MSAASTGEKGDLLKAMTSRVSKCRSTTSKAAIRQSTSGCPISDFGASTKQGMS